MPLKIFVLSRFCFKTFILRFQSLPQLVDRMKHLHDAYRKQSRVVVDLRKKLSYQCELHGTVLDDDSNNDIKSIIISPETEQFISQYPLDSFQRIFWEQQVKASSVKNARNMRWHPLMIRWCLSIRHR